MDLCHLTAALGRPQRRWHRLLQGVLEHVQRELQRQATPQGEATQLPCSSARCSSPAPEYLCKLPDTPMEKRPLVVRHPGAVAARRRALQDAGADTKPAWLPRALLMDIISTQNERLLAGGWPFVHPHSPLAHLSLCRRCTARSSELAARCASCAVQPR